MESLTDTIGLWAECPGSDLADVILGEAKLIGAVLDLAAIFGPTICQYSHHRIVTLGSERNHPVNQDYGGGDGGLLGRDEGLHV